MEGVKYQQRRHYPQPSQMSSSHTLLSHKSWPQLIFFHKTTSSSVHLLATPFVSVTLSLLLRFLTYLVGPILITIFNNCLVTFFPGKVILVHTKVSWFSGHCTDVRYTPLRAISVLRAEYKRREVGKEFMRGLIGTMGSLLDAEAHACRVRE